MDNKRTALILGNGDYADYLNELRRTGVACLSIGALSRQQSSVQDCDKYLSGPMTLELLGEVEGLLIDQKIERLVVGGDFRLLDTMSGATPGGRVVELPTNDPRRDLIQKVRWFLRQHDIQAIRATELLPELNPGHGLLTPNSPQIPESYFLDVLRSSVPRAQRHARFGSRHSLVFDDMDFIREETVSTDEMLSKLKQKPKGCYPRTLVRILPRKERATIDAAVIGEKTIELAAGAGVDAILLDAESCVMFTREKVIRAAEKAKITIFAASVQLAEEETRADL